MALLLVDITHMCRMNESFDRGQLPILSRHGPGLVTTPAVVLG
jgi:hypothetical protein